MFGLIISFPRPSGTLVDPQRFVAALLYRGIFRRVSTI